MKIHPLTLILIVIWVTSAALFSEDIAILLILLSLSTLLCLLRHKNPVKPLVRTLPLLLIVFILQVLFRQGEQVLWSYGWLSVSVEGVMMAVHVILRLSIILMSAVLLNGLQFNDFRNAFSLIRMPEELSFMVSLVIHFVPMLAQRFKDKVTLLRYRGLDIKHGSPILKVKLYRIIVLSVLTGLLQNVKRQAIALKLRGFRRPCQKTSRYQSGLLLSDWLVFLILIVASVLLWAISRWPDVSP